MKFRGGLGKGLSALLQEDTTDIVNESGIITLRTESIEPNIDQPRKNIDYDKIRELANSIENNGLLQPIIVTPINDGRYKIVAGERRWQACQMIGLIDIPVIIKDLSDKEILEIALIENIQREELSAIEEAESFAKLIQEFGYTQDQLAQSLSKSRSHVANLLRLINLPQSIKDKVNDGSLSMGHARCLVNHEDAELIAQQIIERDLSVRQTESLVKNWGKLSSAQENYSAIIRDTGKDDELKNISNILSEKFGTRVIIESSKSGNGRIIINYQDFEALDAILSILG